MGEQGKVILVVEDMEAIRRLVASALRSLGHEVLECGDANCALETSRAVAGPIHLLITDIQMSGMSGKELGEALCHSRPGLKILYISGYSEFEMGELDACGNREGYYLQKPFTVPILRTKVSQIFERG